MVVGDLGGTADIAAEVDRVVLVMDSDLPKKSTDTRGRWKDLLMPPSVDTDDHARKQQFAGNIWKQTEPTL